MSKKCLTNCCMYRKAQIHNNKLTECCYTQKTSTAIMAITQTIDHSELFYYLWQKRTSLDRSTKKYNLVLRNVGHQLLQMHGSTCPQGRLCGLALPELVPLPVPLLLCHPAHLHLPLTLLQACLDPLLALLVWG